MIQDRYYLTTGSEALLQEWYDKKNIMQVNNDIDKVFECLYKISCWNNQQKELFKVLTQELEVL